MPNVPEVQESLPKMSFGDHLDELRRRLVRALLAIGVGCFALMPFKSAVTAFYVAPYHQMWQRGFVEYVDRIEREVIAAGGPERAFDRPFGALQRERWDFLSTYKDAILAGTFPFEALGHKIKETGGYLVPYHLTATGGIEDFWTFMAASFLFGVLLASPVVLYQAWAFVAAGLYQHERRTILKFVPWAVVLLVGGAAFGFLVVVPYGLFMLVQLMNFGQVQPLISVSQYFSLLFTLTTALGLVFQLPLVMLAIQRIGLVSHATLVKHWRWIILIIFLIAAVATPPDPFTQSMMALPMCALYGIGLLFTARAERARLRVAGAPAQEGA